MVVVLALHLPRTSQSTRRSNASNASTDAIRPSVTEKPAPDARPVARTRRADALLGVVAVPLTGDDTGCGVYAGALGGRLTAVGVYAGCCRPANAIDRSAEDA
jgi:hypothetical protein